MSKLSKKFNEWRAKRRVAEKEKIRKDKRDLKRDKDLIKTKESQKRKTLKTKKKLETRHKMSELRHKTAQRSAMLAAASKASSDISSAVQKAQEPEVKESLITGGSGSQGTTNDPDSTTNSGWYEW